MGGSVDNAAWTLQRCDAERDHPKSHGVRKLGRQDQTQEDIRHKDAEEARSLGTSFVHWFVVFSFCLVIDL